MFVGCWIFTDREIFRFVLQLKLKLNKVCRIMLCIFLLLCAIRRPQSLKLFDVVCYSQTPSNRESWGGLFLKANLSSIAVQLSDNFSEIWSSTCTILFRDEIAILHVFDEDKIAITSLLRRPFPVQASIQLPCFSIEYSRLTTLLSTLLWYFDFVLWRRFYIVQSVGTLP